MKKAFIPIPCITLVMLMLCGAPPTLAQKSKKTSAVEFRVPLTPANWQASPDGVEFTTHKNALAMKISGKERIILKNFAFANGTIEYDVEPLAEGFAGMYFRMADNNEAEYLYLRTSRASNPVAMDAVQYAPYNKGVLLWDMFCWFQGPANIKNDDWNHIKVIISGAQMIVYVNDLKTSTLEIPQLEGNTQTGSIAFDGKCLVANVVIKDGATENLSPRAGFDPTHHDPRYIRTWQVSKPQDL
ncbi:MAG TPA: family 16 glycoside hydrolase, partial [Chryseolinea sp.]|nr:family 16 glycoside hydrolase [Chryseolinea sp.]